MVHTTNLLYPTFSASYQLFYAPRLNKKKKKTKKDHEKKTEKKMSIITEKTPDFINFNNYVLKTHFILS